MSSIKELRDAYLAKTVASRRLYERARKVLPGGTGRGATAFTPYPLYGEYAQGAILTDIDGNEYIDFNLEGGSCLFGHRSPVVMDAVRSQLGRSEVQSIASPLEVEVAERLTRFIPSMEMVRFLNSGSEACAIAARLARAFTGRSLIAMCEGHHHGQLDALLFSHYGPPVGTDNAPETVRDSLGMSPDIEKNVIVLPFNDPEQSVRIIEANKDRLAAVFLEPMTIFGGAIPADPQFIQALRRTTANHDILLVADEVPAGVRIGRGGAIATYGVQPDLFITGKALAGGLPVGVYGGRRDILDPLLSPPHDRKTKAHSSGTFSANPTVMSACLAVLEALESGTVNRELDRLGEQVRGELRTLADQLGVPMQVTGAHSIFGIHFVEQVPHSARHIQGDQRRADFSLAMMANGILWPAGRIAGFVCTAHTAQHIDKFIEACRIAVAAAYLESSEP